MRWCLKSPAWLNGSLMCRSKKTSKLRVTGLCAGDSPVTDEFPAQMASNAENVSIWWRHHELFTPCQHTTSTRSKHSVSQRIIFQILIDYTLPAKSMEYFEAKWKHSHLTFWFAGNGLASTTTKYFHFNAFLMHSVRGEKYNLQCPKLKLHKIIYGDLSFFNTSHKISQSFQGS